MLVFGGRVTLNTLCLAYFDGAGFVFIFAMFVFAVLISR